MHLTLPFVPVSANALPGARIESRMPVWFAHKLNLPNRFAGRVLLTVLTLLPVVQAADFWQAKAPDAWTEKEWEKMRTKSPWATKEVQEERTTEKTLVTTGSGKSAKTVTKQKQVWARVGDVQFRWESAAPLLAATARIDPVASRAFVQLAADFYLVSVTGLGSPGGTSVDAATKELSLGTSMDLGKLRVAPKLVRAITSEGGISFLLQFARDLELEKAGKDLKLEVQLGKTRTTAWFQPGRMVFQDRMAL